MAIPKLTYNVVFQPNVVNRLSNIPPYDTCTVNFTSNVHIKEFYARITFPLVEPNWGPEEGLLIASFTNRDANVQLSFDIVASQHMWFGDGTYRVGLYLLDDNDVWNMDEIFVTTESNNTNLNFQTHEEEDLYVGQSQKLTDMTVIVGAGATIDLNKLNGLSTTRIIWGDGTTTHSGTQHTYTNAGTYVIRANFQDVNRINDYFLYQNTGLISINFTNFKNVKVIGYHFLQECQNLTAINISGFTGANSIGGDFLKGCSSLASIDLSPLEYVASMPDNFLHNCSSLTSIDLSSWTRLNNLGENFLMGTGITSLNLSSNTIISSIGTGFLRNCTNLVTLTVPPTTPATLGGWGANLTSLTNIITGAEHLDEYKSADVWKEKKDLMKASL